MSGDDGRDQGAPQCLFDGGRVDIGCIKFGVRGRESAVAGRFTRVDVDGPSTLAVDVLGQVGEQCEVTERPDDGNGVVRTDFGEQRNQFGAVDLRPTDTKRLDAGSLD